MSNTFVVSEEQSRMRLDQWLTDHYLDISRAYLQKLCTSGEILVNGISQKSGYKLHMGDKIKVIHKMEAVGKPPSIELPIIYEDKNVIVIDKPAGILAHGLSKFHNEPSVASFLRQKTTQKNKNFRAGIVHRLDRATSGIMISAKNDETMVYLQKQFADRKVQKTYLAVVAGHPEQNEALLDLPLERNPKSPARFRVGPNGKPAQTYMRILSQNDKYSLVELKPQTGRTHQLRVHMAYLHTPIVGDLLYEGEESSRMLLHAANLELMVPGIGLQKFVSNIPKEFTEYVDVAS